jgi:hypothetical protein
VPHCSAISNKKTALADAAGAVQRKTMRRR